MFQTKCENYLPEDNCSCMFGDIEVKVDKVKVKQGYTVRLLTLKVGKVDDFLQFPPPIKLTVTK
jgi:hypothetical protein